VPSFFSIAKVYQRDTDWGLNAARAKPKRYLLTVLTPTEVNAVFQHLSGPPQLIIKVLYGTGLRLCEGLRLRVKDLDFAQGQIVMRDVKGHEGRVTMLPQSLVEPLTQQLQ
jgi:integrase